MNSKNGDTIQALPPGPRPLPLLSVPLYVRKGFSQYFNVKSRPGFWKHRIDSQEGYQGGGGAKGTSGSARPARPLSHTHTHTLFLSFLPPRRRSRFSCAMQSLKGEPRHYAVAVVHGPLPHPLDLSSLSFFSASNVICFLVSFSSYSTVLRIAARVVY